MLACKTLVICEKMAVFVACAIKTFLSTYQRDKFSENGPVLLTKLLTDEVETCPNISSTVNVLPASAFQPIHWSEMKERLLSTPMKFTEDNYVFHYNSHAVIGWDSKGSNEFLTNEGNHGTLLHQILYSFCASCQMEGERQ